MTLCAGRAWGCGHEAATTYWTLLLRPYTAAQKGHGSTDGTRIWNSPGHPAVRPSPLAIPLQHMPYVCRDFTTWCMQPPRYHHSHPHSSLLQLLERHSNAIVLVQVAGPALPADTRSNLDALAMHMATVTTDAAVRVTREPGAAAAARAPEVAALRAAAARALVASVASPLASRPPFLAQAVALLTAGADGGGGAELAAVCQEGLLAVEALLRPRAAPITALYGSGTAMYGGGNGVADGWGGCGSGASAGAAALGQLPRPRMWSVLDPVAPVVVQVAAAATAAPGGAKEMVAAAAPASGGDVAMVDAAVAKARDGGAKAEAKGGAGAAKAREEQAEEEEEEEQEEEEAAPAAAKSKGKNKGKGKEKGKEAAAAGVKGGAKAATQAATPAAGAKRQRGGEGAATPAGAAPAAAGKGGKAAAEKAGGSTAAAAAKPAAAAAAAVAPKPAMPAVPPPAPAAAVFGEESEDSEGSLPEIDSGSSSGDDE